MIKKAGSTAERKLTLTVTVDPLVIAHYKAKAIKEHETFSSCINKALWKEIDFEEKVLAEAREKKQ